jgi:hypothetical protein
LRFLVIGDADPNSDQIAFALSARDDLLRGFCWQSSNRREELPLVGVRAEVEVNKHAIVRFA